MSSIIHIVQFKFKPGTDEKAVRRVCDDFLSLKDKAIHPTSKKPYIKSASGGRDNSSEGLQNGFTHAFVIEFENEEDRNFYVRKDKAHQAFVASLEGLVDGAQVLDYTPDVLTGLKIFTVQVAGSEMETMDEIGSSLIASFYQRSKFFIAVHR